MDEMELRMMQTFCQLIYIITTRSLADWFISIDETKTEWTFIQENTGWMSRNGEWKI